MTEALLTLLRQRHSRYLPVGYAAVLSAGLRTGDIWSEGTTKVGTREMGDAVVAALMGKVAGKTTITTKT